MLGEVERVVAPKFCRIRLAVRHHSYHPKLYILPHSTPELRFYSVIHETERAWTTLNFKKEVHVIMII